MIWCIIIATVHLFQNDYVMCTENAPSLRDGLDSQLLHYPFMVSVNRYNFTTQMMRFICVGVLVDKHYVLTAATCVLGSSNRNRLVIYTGDVANNTLRSSILRGMVFDPQTAGIHKNIALLKLAFPLASTLPVILPLLNAATTGSIIKVISYSFMSMYNGIYIKSLRTQYLQISDNVPNVPDNSFAARYYNHTDLDADDVGSPAFVDGIFVGFLSEAPFGTKQSIFTDVSSCMSFIVFNVWNN